MELKDIKSARVRFGLTQSELAKEAGVSQSIVAKLESGRIDPSFSVVKRIFAVLENKRSKNSPRAFDIMQSKVIFVRPDDSVSSAVKLMKKHAISQMPVFDEKVLGLVSESIILSHVNDLKKSVSEIMAPSPPIVPKDADSLVVRNLLQFYPVVLVSDKGKIIGLITKSDLLCSLI